MSKKVFLFVLAFLLAFSLCGTALAAEDPSEAASAGGIITPFYTYISYTSCSMTINSAGKASMVASISAYSGVDSVKISGYLQQYYNGSWRSLQHWTADATGTYVAMAKSYYVTSGYQYRWICYYYAYDGSNTESTSDAVYDSY